jgi:hypothetical protein
MAQPDERETRGLYEGLLAASDKHVSEVTGASIHEDTLHKDTSESERRDQRKEG